jgi:hypothetical protein
MIPEEAEGTPADGYKAIARALNKGVLVYKRHVSLISANEKKWSATASWQARK